MSINDNWGGDVFGKQASPNLSGDDADSSGDYVWDGISFPIGVK